MNFKITSGWFKKSFWILILIWVSGFDGYTQQISNLRMKYLNTKQDTLALDTLSIIPASVSLWNDSVLIDQSSYTLDPGRAILIWNKSSSAFKTLNSDSLMCIYRVFPLSFIQTFKHKDLTRIEKKYKGLYNPFEYNEKVSDFDIFKLKGLNRSGSISRGISFGNAQDVVVNSSLNLQLSGMLNDNIEILASVTDNNVPIQAEGNTQQIQDFDKVFIQLSNQNSRLLAGDFELLKPESYFMNFYKKAQGGIFSTKINLTPKNDTAHFHLMHATLSASISKGKYARNIIQGSESNQGPYRLTGVDNELFIVILSGSERVFVDGLPMARGQEYDYVIDYNTAQLTFTSKRLITKDSRITIEFQYSDKNYARSLLFFSDTYTQKNLKLTLNVYSEQDAKNQPLLQTIDNEQKILLAAIGDSIQQAFYLNEDSVAFNNNEVLYAKRETITGIDTVTIYVYSNSPDSAFYRLGFSFVGVNKGNYVSLTTAANGKVYAWVAPINNVPQGSYEPYTLLITPKKQQLVTLGGEYKVGNNLNIQAEGAVSNYDANLFSDKNKGDDAGYAGTVKITHIQPLKKGWKINTSLLAEHVNKLFKPLESFRNIEFTRDWNLGSLSLNEDENSGIFSTGVSKSNMHFINYQFKTFQKGLAYKGYMHGLNLGSTYKGFTLLANGNYLTTSGTSIKSIYIKNKADLSKRINKFVIGINQQQERNSILQPEADTLLYSSFFFQQYQAYASVGDSSIGKIKTDYTRRYDYTPRNNQYKLSTLADNASINMELMQNTQIHLEAGAIYRNLTIKDSTLSSLKNENSLLTNLQLDLTFLKGGIVSNSYYEIGTGQELKKEYSYIQVAAGTGAYIWNDYNNNNIKELNEFEIAAFATEADYLKIYTPTNSYIKTHTNLLSQVLNINPSAFVKGNGFFKFICRFNNQFALKLDNKTEDNRLEKNLNPFNTNVDDSTLISTNSTFRNTLFFNRSSTVFGMDATYQALQSKSLLTNGFESRVQQSINSNIRINFNKTFSMSAFGENGYKLSKSEFFSARDYNIRYGSVEPRFSIQPGNNFRATLSYEYKIKKNTVSEAGELSTQHDFGLELKYSSVKRGSITGKINYINIAYNQADNTSLAYEMLEGLKTGKNMTWGLSAQQSLSGSLQVNINYEGRKSPNVKAIHTGGVQLTAYF